MSCNNDLDIWGATKCSFAGDLCIQMYIAIYQASWGRQIQSQGCHPTCQSMNEKLILDIYFETVLMKWKLKTVFVYLLIVVIECSGTGGGHNNIVLEVYGGCFSVLYIYVCLQVRAHACASPPIQRANPPLNMSRVLLCNCAYQSPPRPPADRNTHSRTVCTLRYIVCCTAATSTQP